MFDRFGRPKGWSKRPPKRSKKEPKIKTKMTSIFYPSWSRLGAILGRSWTASVGQKSDLPLVLQRFCEKVCFRTKRASRRISDPTCLDLTLQKGAITTPRQVQKGPKKEFKIEAQKRSQNGPAQGGLTRFGPPHARPRGPPGGVRG